MKFALRDDDLNYFFRPLDIENNYKEIWDICPVSMSVVPFIKGNWPKYIIEAAEKGPGNFSQEEIEIIINDNKVYPIGDNSELVDFICEKIKENKIHLTFHSIHHRNEDNIIPHFKRNYGIGAEFYTSRDLSEPLADAIKYVENTFNQPIKVFTPPQNLLNLNGIKAIRKNNLAICGGFPRLKNLSTLKLFGLTNYLNYVFFKFKHNFKAYPFVITNEEYKIVGHHSLQPGSNIEELYLAFENNYKLNGSFVVSTHSYGFNVKMKNSNKTMGETLKEFILFVSKKSNIQFVKLNQIFEEQ